MSTDRVLGHLARRFAVSEENIATVALTWILGRSKAERSAVIGLARSTGCDLPDDLNFIGQVGNPETGRPDIVGSDSDNRQRLVIEAKFAAALTPQQPNGYLKQLRPDADSMVLVVAPAVRCPTLWVELLRQVDKTTAPAPSTIAGSTFLHRKVEPRATLAVIDWRRLVTRVLEALQAADESALAHDAEQLIALTESMDSSAFIPFGPADFAMHTAHQIDQLHPIIDLVRSKIAKDTRSVAMPDGPKQSYGRIFYGWVLRSRKTKKVLWFGFHVSPWAEHGLTPLWIRVKISESWSRQRLLEALRGLREDGQSGVFEQNDTSFMIPVTIPHFVGRDEVAAALKEQVEDVFARLDAVIPETEHPVPDKVTPDAGTP
ncbi:MAG: hypothetical protein ABWY11_20355 [Umezawaea sp.]